MMHRPAPGALSLTDGGRRPRRGLRHAAAHLVLGAGLAVVTAGLCLPASLAWAQARGAIQPEAAPTPVNPAPIIIPPVSAEPVSARLIIRLEQVERQAAEMTGRIEVLESELAQQRASQSRLLQELEAERANRAASITEGAPASGDSQAVRGSEVGSAKPSTTETESPKPAIAETSTQTPAVPPPPQASAEALYRAAELALQRGDYQSAEANLNDLVSFYPAAPEGVEGRWLLGETRFVQSAWGPAAEAYLSYLNTAPQGRRASESLLRLAGAFGQMGNSKMRCSALAEFRRRTPAPDPTLKARADAEAGRAPCPTT